MTETEINVVLKQVWRLTMESGMTTGEALELHARAIMSLALADNKKDSLKASEAVKDLMTSMMGALLDPDTRIKRTTLKAVRKTH